MINLYGLASPNVLKVMIMLEETGLPSRFHYVNVGQGEHFQEAFVRLNPNSKVPVIVDDAGLSGAPQTVFESGAILLYLAEKAGRLIPQDPAGRFEVLQWLFFQMAGPGPILGQLTHFLFMAPEPNPYALSRYRTEAARLYDVVEQRLAHSAYLGGDDYSVADIALYPWISIYHERHGMDLAGRPKIRGWLAAIGERPAVRRAEGAYQRLKNEDPAKMDPDARDRVFGWGRYARA